MTEGTPVGGELFADDGARHYADQLWDEGVMGLIPGIPESTPSNLSSALTLFSANPRREGEGTVSSSGTDGGTGPLVLNQASGRESSEERQYQAARLGTVIQGMVRETLEAPQGFFSRAHAVVTGGR